MVRGNFTDIQGMPRDTKTDFFYDFSATLHFSEIYKIPNTITHREVTSEEEQRDGEKFMVMMKEYEMYKDQWGLNIHYSHSAGATQNYSEFPASKLTIFSSLFSAEKKGLDLQVVHIYLDTSTFDRVEKDVKVS